MEKVIDLLYERHACRIGLRFVAKYDNPRAAWEECKRGDWMMWLLYTLSVDLRIINAIRDELDELDRDDDMETLRVYADIIRKHVSFDDLNLDRYLEEGSPCTQQPATK